MHRQVKNSRKKLILQEGNDSTRVKRGNYVMDSWAVARSHSLHAACGSEETVSVGPCVLGGTVQTSAN